MLAIADVDGRRGRTIKSMIMPIRKICAESDLMHMAVAIGNGFAGDGCKAVVMTIAAFAINSRAADDLVDMTLSFVISAAIPLVAIASAAILFFVITTTAIPFVTIASAAIPFVAIATTAIPFITITSAAILFVAIASATLHICIVSV